MYFKYLGISYASLDGFWMRVRGIYDWKYSDTEDAFVVVLILKRNVCKNAKMLLAKLNDFKGLYCKLVNPCN